jgi:Zn-dependent peptidase ImmA (M78 family)/transcriptional regulator with XRE-family HTH domain
MATVGDMLRLARHRAGLTQKDAAARLGVVQPILSRMENGAAEIEDAILMRASQAYSVPRAFFSLSDTVYGAPVSVHPMARAKADVTARDLDMVTAELNIRIMHLKRFLENVDFQHGANLPALDFDAYGSAAKVAAIVRSHWGVPPGPIRNLTALVERAGVVVDTSDFGGASISGMTFKVPGLPPLVLLNRQHPADRLRFTLAHELGHLVMHRFPTPTMEAEADSFASAMLLPKNELQQAFEGRDVTLQLLAALKPEWKVSMASLLKAAGDHRFITPNQGRYLWQQLSSRGWRLREPPELDFAREQPKTVNSIIKAHLNDLGFSITDLCNLVPLFESDFRNLYGGIDQSGEDPKPRLRIVT